MNNNPNIILAVVKTDHEKMEFARRLQAAFAAGAEAAGIGSDDLPVPSDEDINRTFSISNVDIFNILANGKPVGGAVVVPGDAARAHSLHFFFTDVGYHSQGFGLAAWSAIEQHYLDARAWETVTPYFEQRNIHFYVNKCGFSIVEFFHPGHPDPNEPEINAEDPCPMFRFRKAMR